MKLFPPHTSYIEPFAGSAAVLLAKPQSKFEVINDLNLRVWNFFTVVRTRCDELIELVEATPYHREEFRRAIERSEDPLEDARRYLVVSWQAFQGGGATYRPDQWRRIKGLAEAGFSPPSKVWKTLPSKIKPLARRLAGVQIDHLDALQAIRDYDRPGNLLYIDPPYHPTSRRDVRKTHGQYEVELDGDRHAELLDLLNSAQSMIVLSGRHGEAYDEALDTWDLHEFNQPRHGMPWGSAAPKNVLECVWRNEAAVQAAKKGFHPVARGDQLQRRFQEVSA